MIVPKFDSSSARCPRVPSQTPLPPQGPESAIYIDELSADCWPDFRIPRHWPCRKIRCSLHPTSDPEGASI